MLVGIPDDRRIAACVIQSREERRFFPALP
jgi:hypothetical protein